jgi:hypothetical protein
MCDGIDHHHDHGPLDEHGRHHAHGKDESSHGHHEVTKAPQGGPVVLDVGGNIGAMIVHLDSEWLGHEIHVRRIRPDGSLANATVHTGVWERPMGPALMVVAVFCELVEGSYQLLDQHRQSVMVVEIVGGQVVEHDLRSAVRPNCGQLASV